MELVNMDYYYNLPVTRMPGVTPTPVKRQCPDLNTTMFVNPMNSINSLNSLNSINSINSMTPLAAVQNAAACTPMLRPQATLMPFPGAISNPVITNNPSRKYTVHRSTKVAASVNNSSLSTGYGVHTVGKNTSSPSSLSSTSSSTRATPMLTNGNTSSSSNTAVSDNDDILICGSCRQLFKSLADLTDHKKFKCRVPCNCASRNYAISKEPSSFTCASCHIEFESCWSLCQHCQNEHGLQIFLDNSKTTALEKSVVKTSGTDTTSGDNALDTEVPQMLNSYDKIDGGTAVLNGV